MLGNASVNSTALTVNSNANSTFSGSILEAQAASSLIKTGPNALTLNGTGSTYTGATTINQGVLAASSQSLGSGPIALAGGTFRPLNLGQAGLLRKPSPTPIILTLRPLVGPTTASPPVPWPASTPAATTPTMPLPGALDPLARQLGTEFS